jgi:ABC-2 type transport system permease protein
MKNSITWKVAKWEFNRFFKWMDMLKGVLFFGAFAVIGGVIGTWLASDSLKTPTIAVADYGSFDPTDFETRGFHFVDHTESNREELESLLNNGDIDAILTLISTDEAEIRLQNERAWLFLLENFINEKRTQIKLHEFNIDEGVFASIKAGITLNRTFDKAVETSILDKILAGVAIFLVLIAVFMGFAYQFTAITAEKQQRITEQVVSAISPQTWIDGKILGITGIGLVYVIFYGGLGLVGIVAAVAFGLPLGELLNLINPLLIVTFLLLSLLGILMWNSFLAGVAATIDDPNSSQRTSWMLLPMLPVSLAFFTLVNPDTFAITFLGIFPLTSYAVLPARMVLTQVDWWEPILALVLLAGTAWLFRLVAGKIFATGMMLYGKEPDFKEMFHWFRKA